MGVSQSKSLFCNLFSCQNCWSLKLEATFEQRVLHVKAPRTTAASKSCLRQLPQRTWPDHMGMCQLVCFFSVSVFDFVSTFTEKWLYANPYPWNQIEWSEFQTWDKLHFCSTPLQHDPFSSGHQVWLLQVSSGIWSLPYELRAYEVHTGGILNLVQGSRSRSLGCETKSVCLLTFWDWMVRKWVERDPKPMVSVWADVIWLCN